jgi:hypothetical protein
LTAKRFDELLIEAFTYWFFFWLMKN